MDNIEKIKSKLHTKILGRQIIYLQEVRFNTGIH